MIQGSAPFRNPLCVALDVSDLDQARSLVDQLADVVGGFKLGPRLLMKAPGLVAEIAGRAPVFVDCKYFDIPSTMESAVQSCFEAGASLVTIHSMAGSEALQQLAALEEKLNQSRPFRILAVSILTSWTEASYPPVIKVGTPGEHVQSLAAYARQAGLSGLVCSVQELNLIEKDLHYVVTPGIRRPQDAMADQKRTAGPREALDRGSNLLVVGRPIIGAPHPRREAEAFLGEL